MTPSSHHLTNQLRQLIYYNLDCNLLRNALFLAGRLHAYEPRASEAAYLLSLCYLRLGEYKSAYDNSKSYGTKGTHLGCCYIFAQACLALEKFSEGIIALEKSKTHWATRNSWNKHTETRRQQLPDAAAVYCLQGKLLHAYDDANRAIECYAEALKLNPFMWDAFLGLCDLGVNVRISNLFKTTPEMLSALGGSNESFQTAQEEPSPSNSFVSHQSTTSQQPANNDPFSISTNRVNGDNRVNITKSGLFEKLNGSTQNMTPIGSGIRDDPNGLDTPTGLGATNISLLAAQMQWAVDGRTVASVSEVSESSEPPLAPMRKSRTLERLGMDFSNDAPPRMKPSHLRSKSSKVNGESEEYSQSTSTLSTLLASTTDRKRTISGQVPQTASASSANSNAVDAGAPQRRSVRLFNQIRPQSGKFSSGVGSIGTKEGRELKKAKATGTKGRHTQGSTVGRVVSGNRKHVDVADGDTKETRAVPPTTATVTTTVVKPVVSERSKEYESLTWLLELFAKLASGHFALSHYRNQEALQIFSSITQGQRETPWVLAQMGRALYEQGSYAEAEKYFARIKVIAPSRLDDMEVYSTILWHLKSEIDLAFLAHEIIDIDRQSPQAWCAIGNSFSLQRDHDQALKCFKRATQLDPKFAYAWTLQGHEHITNEEYDKAMSAYRNAIAAEKRHYNAWYGLAKVYEKQGKYNVAEQHYRTAASINPTNAVLVCCIGTVLEKMKNPKAALVQYAKSCELDPKSSHPRFKKAKVLMALQQPDQALMELKIVKDIAPDEANVHFLLGRVYKILRDKPNAIKHFTTALNLDPKVRNVTCKLYNFV